MKLLASTIVALCATVAFANPAATTPAAPATTTTTATTAAPAPGTPAAPAHDMAAHGKKPAKMAKMDCTKEENKTKDECKAAHK